ncbi:hypothetical protein POPTR_001G083700v4 [Populus trichocarpa]|uniref:Homeobox-leucine zipper protein n=1 Tax=Populus trichocarpa TaxID=3694 RepID=B9GK74_POPTR|nr:homeobox-leucine zipper protein ATHB-7 [Populus trichocarpa]KAI5601174.1 hypothetical protein BDE02_01G074900 [Populus trichocarpa]PNT53402.1 hypothetical protein POPTR_001G083700v4 [Populus trichocarpa]|eukprot:XP_002297947.1 homeobox-leucine zipper protein ATHB-7 [Populus trichocarpa]
MDPGTHPLSSIQKNAYKRRFTDEQIKFLEFMFESESRPESRVKQQLASELGLEPRQVAIWFQNRRARLKTKQIEKEYSILKASYDVLASSFESLKREKQSLIIQLHKLKNRHVKQHGSRNCGNQLRSSRDGRFENKDTGSESKEKPSSPLDGNENEENRPSSDNNGRNTVNMREEIDILNHTEQTDNSSQWWEFWS